MIRADHEGLCSRPTSPPSEGFVLTDFVVATDVGRSRVRSMGVPGGQVILHGKPTITA
jgi:hypothetical protein